MTEGINEEMDERMNGDNGDYEKEEEKMDDDDGDYEEEELIESPLKRVLMVIFSPQLVFESLSVKSSKLDWIIPVGLSILISLFIMNAGFDYLINDQLEAATERIENNTRFSDEQKEAAIERIEQGMEKMEGIQRISGNVFPVIGIFLGLLVISLTMKGVTHFILHGKLLFGDAFRIGALASMTSLIGSVVKLPLIFYHESFTEAKTSLGILLPEGMDEGFFARLFDIDIFILWYVIIISIGMSVFAKTSLQKALIPMVILWFVFRLAITTITGALSGIGM